ncbi:hypothetical protein N431DRAFT_355505 [Stipitochalara longipes BDJ]|nr:hypothetical protein N431DRAFT_355505 [Stipitochalara longipes BDJ]
MSLLLLFSLLSLAVERTTATGNATTPAVVFSQITPSTNLTWHPCLGNFECAVFDVPLDYSNAAGARAFVPLIKISATTSPYKGMILTNPGGPGESAIDDFINNGVYEASIVGSNYDYVGFEPRGIGYSIPATNCTSSITPIPGIQERSASRRSGQSARLTGPFLGSTFFNDDYEGAVEVGQTCQNLTGGPNDAGPHMSTLYLVQDMLSIVDAYASSSQSQGVQNASLVNFWAFSYGTFVAQTFASMYPDRVGRFVIDGVVDPDDYRSGNLLKNLQSTDEAFSTYFVYCHLAGPTVCPYYTGTSAYDIFNRFEQTVKRLDVTEAEKQGWANATAISLLLEGLKQFAHNVAYEPINAFSALAPVLLFMETASHNATMASVEQFESATGGNITIALGSIEWTRAVACSDTGNVLYNLTLAELANVTAIMEQQSYVGGEFWASLRVACAGWGIGREGKYTGTFGGVTKNQMLFVSNTMDPATPYYK